jgi:RNA polymerase sigma-70 factor (ECF subfamily)
MTHEPRDAILVTGDTAGWSSRVAVSAIGPAKAAGTDDALVRLAQHGDTSAFDLLAAARLEHAYRLALAILRSEPDARDAVQEAFVGAWRQLPSLREPARFDAWLDRIVVNSCRMALRHRRVVRLREIDVEDPEVIAGHANGRESRPGPADGVADADLMRRAILRLDAEKRAILVLHHVEERSVAEIAAVIGIPAGTVKWRLHVARAALQRAYREEVR